MNDSVFRIWFSGLIHFVQNRDPNARCRMCVVVPKADKHVAAIYKVKRITDDCHRPRIVKDGKPILELEKHRVSFELNRADNLFSESISASPGDFGVLRIEDIAGGYADENSEIVSLNPPPEVAAQILLESDSIYFDENLSVRREWTLPEMLTGVLNTVTLSDPVFVEIPGVKSIKLRAHYFGDKPNDPLRNEIPLPGDGEKIEIFIQNRCEEKCDSPFGRLEARREPNSIKIVQIDQDFVHNYQMLNPATRAAMERILPKDKTQKPRFPLPESQFAELTFSPHLCVHLPTAEELQEVLDWIGKIIPLGTGSGSGSDCLGSKGLARFLDLETFLPSSEPLTAVRLAQPDRAKPIESTALQTSNTRSLPSPAASSRKAPA